MITTPFVKIFNHLNMVAHTCFPSRCSLGYIDTHCTMSEQRKKTPPNPIWRPIVILIFLNRTWRNNRALSHLLSAAVLSWPFMSSHDICYSSGFVISRVTLMTVFCRPQGPACLALSLHLRLLFFTGTFLSFIFEVEAGLELVIFLPYFIIPVLES